MQNLHFLWKNTHHSKPSKSKLTKLALKAASYAGLPEDYPWDLDVMFVDDEMMAQYNEEIVGHIGTTDVITLSYFDSDDFIDFEGDTGLELIINPDAALREGKKRKNSSYSREMVLYLVHGMLHAAGEDDLQPDVRKRMRKREREVLKKLTDDGFVFEDIFPENKK
jgi:probable rRNA maturation factor